MEALQASGPLSATGRESRLAVFRLLFPADCPFIASGFGHSRGR
jgi:hypothetical protein